MGTNLSKPALINKALSTVFPQIVSAETILFRKLECGNYSRAETIRGNTVYVLYVCTGDDFVAQCNELNTFLKWLTYTSLYISYTHYHGYESFAKTHKSWAAVLPNARPLMDLFNQRAYILIPIS